MDDEDWKSLERAAQEFWRRDHIEALSVERLREALRLAKGDMLAAIHEIERELAQ